MPNNKSIKALCIALAAIMALTINLSCDAEELPADTFAAENALTENNEQTASENIQAVSEGKNTDKESSESVQDSTENNVGDNSGEDISEVEEAIPDDLSIAINAANFPDQIFRDYISANFDKDGDGFLSAEEIKAAEEINLSDKGVNDLTGIQYFTYLKELYCGWNKLTSIDVSKNLLLNTLYCDYNQLTSLDIKSNPDLVLLSCNRNQLTALDVSLNLKLQYFYCGGNQLASLDVRNNTALEELDCNYNQITALDVSHNPNLTVLSCIGNKLTSLDISNNTKLGYLYCYDNNLTSLNVSFNPKLTELECYWNSLTSLDCSNNPALEELDCNNNQITALDVSHNPNLMELECYCNSLTSLDCSNNPALEALDCSDNQLTSLNVSKNTSLTFLDCSNNNLTSLDIPNSDISWYIIDNTYNIGNINGTFDLSQLPAGFDLSKASDWQGAVCEDGILKQITGIEGENKITYNYNIGGGYSEEFTLVYDEVGIAIDSTSFTDEKFRRYVSDNFDTNKSGVLSAAEIAVVTAIDVSKMDIIDLTGIGIFTELTELKCSGNIIQSLDVSSNTKLKTLICIDSLIKELNVSGCTALEMLSCSKNFMSKLDISNNPELSVLNIDRNFISKLDTSQNPKLRSINCSYNSLEMLDLSGNPMITFINCSGNKLTSLYVKDVIDVICKDNTYLISITSDEYELSKLPGNFDPNKASEWKGAKCVNGRLVDITGIDGENIITYTYDCGNGDSAQFTLYYTVDDGIDTLPITEEYFPDETFRAYISKNFDKDKNDSLSQEERSAVKNIVIKGGAASLKGIEYFTNLNTLNVKENNLSELDLSKNTFLTRIICNDNNISKLILGNKPMLEIITCSDNALTSLDIANAPKLRMIFADNNKLTDIDVSHLSSLTHIMLSYNELTSIDISENYRLTYLWIDNNNITSLNAGNMLDADVYNLDTKDNIFYIIPKNGTYSLENLPGKFDISKASNWQGAECVDGMLKNITGLPSAKDSVRYVTYKYDIGIDVPVTFTLAYTVDKNEDKPVTPTAPTVNYPSPVLPANGVSYEGAAYTADGTAKGWVSIEKAVKNAKKGAVITINLNKNEVVPKRLFKCAMGKDITLVFNSGIYTWTVNCKDITTPKNVHFCAHTADEKLSGKALSDRSYGFKATLTVSLDGKYASLFHYHASADELKYTDSCQINDGKAEFTVDRSANYVIVTGEKPVKVFPSE